MQLLIALLINCINILTNLILILTVIINLTKNKRKKEKSNRNNIHTQKKKNGTIYMTNEYKKDLILNTQLTQTKQIKK